MLDWTGSPRFLTELEQFLTPLPVRCPVGSPFMPRGPDAPDEARLERFGPTCLPGHSAWTELQDWWLVHKSWANTPNWDIAVACEIEGCAGLVLVEAKANWPELGAAGKPLARNASANSRANHERIGHAIREARDGWRHINEWVNISRDSHYQLANRLAFTWKLGMLGIPVVLVYLGFTGDEGIRDAGRPFADDTDWLRAFREYAERCIPMELIDVRHDLGAAPVWVTVRSRAVIEPSPAAS